MLRKEEGVAWLQRCTTTYCLDESGMGELLEDFVDVGKLGQGFTSVDDLQEIDLGDEHKARPMYINVSLTIEQKAIVCELLKEFVECFAWDYTEMPWLSRELVEHTLPIKPGFKPRKELPRNFNPKIVGRIKEGIERLLEAKFIMTCRYDEWVSNIVL
jgi:hypothetical protein